MEPKIKVLFFIESLAGGGAEKILFTIVNHIDKDKFDITVATVVADGVYVNQISRLAKFRPLISTRNKILYKILYHLIYFYLPLKMVYNLFMPKGNNVEIAFCEGFATKLLAFSPAKKKFAWVHTDMLLNPWTQGIVYSSIDKERKTYLRYDKVICVSETVRKSIQTKFEIEANTIYNPIDSEEIINKSKEKVSLPTKKRLRFVSIGRLVEQKGFDRLIKVINKLKNENLDFELWILGDGPEKKDLEDYIEDNHLINYVKIWGFISNPYPYIAASDIFICSSRCEGYSTAVTEALILGIPVITTLCAGMTELLGDNKYGIIVQNEDMALLEPMKKIICDRNYLTMLTDKARERSKDFCISSLMNPIEKLLR
ncbi:glycosyltransferase [Prevotella sp. 10(H)]|uniref:glycosyltransferase n=1 Tax=Prevotella sp. 10(H) TaxID=1158294 RepID=UPI0004A75163|nr:glycosyltransferase [Prevotella sp. 10(H)]